jgi:hypothetical protein
MTEGFFHFQYAYLTIKLNGAHTWEEVCDDTMALIKSTNPSGRRPPLEELIPPADAFIKKHFIIKTNDPQIVLYTLT